jgi:L-alanine-DL-glutamate epimerase-like enolase superfamily enzyme
MQIERIERILVRVPFREPHVQAMGRRSGDWSLVELCKVKADNGLVGWGETVVYYTWAAVTQAAVERALTRNPFELLWDDTLGAGLQMALWDLCGKHAGAPAHRLLGPQCREACPLSYWCMDMAAEEWAAEAERAVRLGYTSLKLKARPWWDLEEQVRHLSRKLPRSFHLDLDFNETLVNAGKGVPYLKRLERYPAVSVFESPIPQKDVEGGKQIRRHVGTPIAHHYGNPPVMTALREDVCDGFVLCGGAHRLAQEAATAAQVGKPFWLQLVGTGITTAWALQQGAVYAQAQWPAITCSEIYTDDLIRTPHIVEDGYVRVPGGPGLGIEVDEDAVEALRVDEARIDCPWDLVCVVWRSGKRAYYRDKMAAMADFLAGNQPGFEPGVRLEYLVAGNSKELIDLRGRVERGPVVVARGTV